MAERISDEYISHENELAFGSGDSRNVSILLSDEDASEISVIGSEFSTRREIKDRSAFFSSSRSLEDASSISFIASNFRRSIFERRDVLSAEESPTSGSFVTLSLPSKATLMKNASSSRSKPIFGIDLRPNDSIRPPKAND